MTVIASIAIAAVAVALIASLHAILYKRDVRAAIGWAGFIWIVPFIGALLYLLFGVNRIRRRAASLRGSKDLATAERSAYAETTPLGNLIRLGDAVCHNALRPGNRIALLDSGAAAFAAMLERIEASRLSVSLATYIFEDDSVGGRFIDALARASARGVVVRVLMDAVGSRDDGFSVSRALSRAGARAARFLPARAPAGILTANLRNHRKLVIVDGETAFTGGMNISDAHARDSRDRKAIRDTHFMIEGPVVSDLQQTFVEDWDFTTGERLAGEAWFPAPKLPGDAETRAVADGPDEDFERTRWIILGAIASARTVIRIVTPYFLPDTALIVALNVAALRGVSVEIMIPERLDHAIVKWASNALLWQVLEKGCRVWFTPPPFDHSKLFTVDGAWALFGSSNWDPRSLRLNFELNLEVFSRSVAAAVDRIIDERRDSGREVTLAMMDSRTLPVRIRDGLARLVSPYL